VLRAPLFLDQVRERIRYKHYSLRTEQAYVQWVRMFVKWHGLRHSRDMGSWKAKIFWSSWLNDGFGSSSWTAAQGRQHQFAAYESCRSGCLVHCDPASFWFEAHCGRLAR